MKFDPDNSVHNLCAAVMEFMSPSVAGDDARNLIFLQHAAISLGWYGSLARFAALLSIDPAMVQVGHALLAYDLGEQKAARVAKLLGKVDDDKSGDAFQVAPTLAEWQAAGYPNGDPFPKGNK